MAAYDSDSSSDDGNDYTTTDVILGYVSNESSGDEVSHVGGHPAWLDPRNTPLPTLVKCKVCNGYMSLLLQLNADLQQYFPSDQRRLQVWICRKKGCARKPGSIRALREVKKGQSNSRTPKVKESGTTTEHKGSGIDLGNALFGGSKVSTSDSTGNPFSTSTSSQGVPANPFSSLASPSALAAKPPQRPTVEKQQLAESFAEKLKIGTTPSTNDVTPAEVWPEPDQFPEPYSFFFLDAYPEELEPTTDQVSASLAEPSKSNYDPDDASSSVDKDNFESSLDKTFQKFSDIVAQNPEQVLRYEFKGQPLLYSGTDGVASRFVVPHGKAGAIKGIPRCEKCGSQRVFEMQLTPYLIFEIEKDEAIDIDSGMEWGAIVVGTCVNNCGDEGMIAFREEWVGVQWEERVSRK